jgi:hypothetical protein
LLTGTSGAVSPPQEADSGLGLEDQLFQLENSLLSVVISGWRGLDLAGFIAHNYGEDMFEKNGKQHQELLCVMSHVQA